MEVDMKVKEVMTGQIETISPDSTLEQAARKMCLHAIGILPVVDEDIILGVVTDRDMVMRGLAEGRPTHLTVIRQVMTPTALTCYEDQSITEVSKLMEKNMVRRLLVLDRNEKLVGLVSLTDLALKVPNEKVSGHVLSKISIAS
jgi:CBS domain-containing protein